MDNSFNNLSHSILNTFNWVKKAFDINHAGLFDALEKLNWPRIRSAIKSPEVNQYAHDHDNALLLLAIEHEQYDLAKYLLTLDKVRNHPLLDSHEPLLAAIGHKKPKAVYYMLENIPSLYKHLTDNNNIILINAIFHKQWRLIRDLVNNPEVQNSLDKSTLQLIFQMIHSTNNEIKGFFTCLLLEIPVFKDYLKSTLSSETFEDLIYLAEANAKLLLEDSMDEIFKNKPKIISPLFNEEKTTTLKRKRSRENTSLIIEEINEPENINERPYKRAKTEL